MDKFINSIYKNQATIYKVVLFILTTTLVVYLFPKGSNFKFELSKGKPWQYETLLAPFDFAIQKSNEEVQKEKDKIKDEHSPFFDFDKNIANRVKENVDDKIENTFSDSIMRASGLQIVKFTKNTLNEIYNRGVVKPQKNFKNTQIIYVKKENEAKETVFKSLLKTDDLDGYLDEHIKTAGLDNYRSGLRKMFFDIIEPNVIYDDELTEKDLQNKIDNISYTKGIVTQGSRIISKGDIIDANKLQILESLKKEYQSDFWNTSNYSIVIAGYSLLVGLALLMLFLFIKTYSPSIYENNKELTFVFFNVILIIAITVMALNVEVNYIYAVPICILPITLNAFFEKRLGLFVHIIAVIILGFIVPNSFEFMFIQIIAGVVAVLSFTELYKRANLFISVGEVTMVYIFAYFAFTVIQEGNFMALSPAIIAMFVINGVLMLFVQPLIYAYEKVFGLLSDMSLLELSNTNSKLMKELANKAPGTFHHSLNVANLAEAAANEIGANAMLVRVGALHHDIGKMINPAYFTENQVTNVNPHDDLPPLESAKIIINHVIYGIEMAKNHNLPDRIIDFIRTHHGQTVIYYFYKKAEQQAERDGGTVNLEDYQYPGPKPFSKETAILMMADSVEAASKSLREPTTEKIDDFVEKIIDHQMDAGQFLNADITFKEIQTIKKVLKRKLNNIYHLRIEYPE